ncbi:hypothetical protein GRF59_10835 [Paenibacillus sp. HJL G12]|uniref:HTTM-like domain-containing protein n=1 Tax=Paenibacillus dendrobii TaxID=2691084 RepID=A0A7X3IHP2_9BACL|nr:HTTM domain-containing protein [Paenibacillus dendrobii]MWV44127.1 hypothetical protein [Paenibacillus dendrobii]
MKIGAWIDKAIDVISVPRHQVGMKLVRIIIGVILLYIYSVNYGQRFFLFGPDGVFSDSNLFSLFHVDSPLVFNILYHVAILAALCFTIGWGGRIIVFINFLFFWSWTSVSLLIGDGGDNLLRVMFPYLILTDLFGKLDSKPTTLWKKALGILHNFGWMAVILQICYVYFTAGLMKIQGGMWQDGTALYYILQVDEFRNPLFSSLIVNHPWTSVAGSYVTIFFQIAFPFLILYRRVKPFVIAVSIMFHLGIWVFMNLPSFSLVMIAFELPLLSDGFYYKVAGMFRSRWSGLKRRFVLSTDKKQTVNREVS